MTERGTGESRGTLLKIEQPTQRSVVRTLDTLPVNPIYARIWLSCSDKPSNSYPNSSRYVEQCVARGIIPSSYATLGYDRDSEAFEPESRVEIGYARGSKADKDLVVESLLNGSRLENIQFKMTWDAEGGFNAFRDKWLGRISGLAYRISSFDLWFTALLEGERYDARGQRSEDSLNYWGKDITLMVGRKQSKTDANKLQRWFRELSPKVSRFQVQPQQAWVPDSI